MNSEGFVVDIQLPFIGKIKNQRV